MSQLSLTGAGRSAAAAGYTFPLLTLFGEVERLAASGDYSLTCGTGAETLPVEFVNNAGNVTISADTNWGSATADQRLLAVRVRGDLTIDATKTLTTAARKLGLLIFCDGDVTVNGTLSMTARGANHSATGSNLTAFDTMLYEVSAAADNIWPAVGGNGAAGRPNNDFGGGYDGTAGVNGACGGGGSGASQSSAGKGACGDGASGTGYAGGPGSGGNYNSVTESENGGASGGKGGDATAASSGAGGGAGNPGGVLAASGANGDSGVGGVIIMIVFGGVSVGAAGVVSANGKNGGAGGVGWGVGGGASGGGSISLYHVGAYTNNGTIQANGGIGGARGALWVGVGDRDGGNGGAGSIREVTL